MELKEGYKQTEVGVIPEDWELQVLRDVASVKRGGSPRPIEAFITDNPEGVNWIKIGDTTKGGKYITSTKERIRTEGTSMSREVKIGQLLLSNSMSFGRPYLLKLDGCIHDGWLVLQDFELTLDNDFFYYLLSGNQILDQYKKLAAGSGVQNLNKEVVGNVILAFPKLKEQQAIAEVLSDVDAEIESLARRHEKLISQKQGLSEQLLSGRTRLVEPKSKGFKQTDVGVIPEDWEVKSLIDIVDGDKSLFDDGDWIESEFIIDEGIRLVQTGNIGVGRFIEKDTKRFISQESFEFLKCKRLCHGDILICRLAEPAGRACVFQPELSQDCVTSVDVTIFRPSVDLVSREFLSQFFSSPVWLHAVSENAGGTTHKRISRGSLGRLCAPLPSLKEQQAIAEVLSDVDAEIQAVAKLKAKVQAKKEGLMQTLLTGKIRLT